MIPVTTPGNIRTRSPSAARSRSCSPATRTRSPGCGPVAEIAALISQLYNYLTDRDDLVGAVIADRVEQVLSRQESLLADLVSIEGLRPLTAGLGAVLAPALPLASRLGGSAGFSALIVLAEAEPGERQELADAVARLYQVLVSDHPREVRTLPERAHDPRAVAGHQDSGRGTHGWIGRRQEVGWRDGTDGHRIASDRRRA